MAVISICSSVSCNDQVHPTTKGIRQFPRGTTECRLPLQKECRCLSPSLVGETDRKWNVLRHGSELILKANGRQKVLAFWMVCNRSMPLKKSIGIPPLMVYNSDSHENCSSGSSYQRDKACSESYALETDSTERQLKALDSYFRKLHGDMDEHLSSRSNGSHAEEYHKESSSRLEGQMKEIADTGSSQNKTKTSLDSLENYFGEIYTGLDTRKGTSTTLYEETSEGHPIRRPNSASRGFHEKEKMMEPGSFEHLESVDNEAGQVLFGEENIQDLQTYDEASDFYLINLLVAINIAVFLFEIASPIRNSEVEHLSLPLVYGAKINKLILVGEWWRLLTPMFLHSGFLHVALGCWVLLTFGPQVCRGYGPFTFFLLYILGGICGNLTSFIHTPELTVCGTGPVFAIIGAWLVYQIQNKQVVAKDVSESMFWKAVTATALSFVLSNFGRIDDWTHLGAAFSGIFFGYLTCPTLQLLDNTSSSKNGQKQEGIALVQRQADPCKSLLTFTISIFILTCLVIFYGPQVELLELDGFE